MLLIPDPIEPISPSETQNPFELPPALDDQALDALLFEPEVFELKAFEPEVFEPEPDQALDEIVHQFTDLQADLNYQQAQAALRELVDRLDLTAREKSGLETELHRLDLMLEKLDRQVIHIAVFGMVGRGKSSLLNALLGQEIFATGPIHGVTQTLQSARWNATREAVTGGDLWRVSLPGQGNSCIELIDSGRID